MPSATNIGSTIHIYGVDGTEIAALLNATIQSVSVDESPNINEDVMDSLGRTIQKRYDDIRQSLQAEGILIGSGAYAGQSVAPGAVISGTFNYDGKEFIVESVSTRGVNRGFASISFQATYYPEVSTGGGA